VRGRVNRSLLINRVLITCVLENMPLTQSFCVDGCSLDETPPFADLLSGCSPCYSLAGRAESRRALKRDHDHRRVPSSCCCLHRLRCFLGTELLRSGTLAYRLDLSQEQISTGLLIPGPYRPVFELLACFGAS